MSTDPSIDDKYAEAIAPVVEQLDERRWEAARAMTIGGAGLSTALVFLITQIGLDGCDLKVSFFCAALAIPVWLALWQVGEAYSTYGNASHGHFAKLQGSGVGILLFFLGGFLLLVSFTTLIWHFSVVASCAFFFASIAMVIFVYWHQNSVRNWVQSNKR